MENQILFGSKSLLLSSSQHIHPHQGLHNYTVAGQMGFVQKKYFQFQLNNFLAEKVDLVEVHHQHLSEEFQNLQLF